jgi:hypothetical protein
VDKTVIVLKREERARILLLTPPDLANLPRLNGVAFFFFDQG